MRPLFPALLALPLFLASPAPPARAQAAEEEQMTAARAVLRDVMAIPARCIPASLLADAQGVVIIPNTLMGGFIVAAQHGHGVAVTRDANGAWRSPVFVKYTGGSVGLQAGLQATDVILVFRTQAGVNAMLRGAFTIGADASVAAGPVGRNAAAATDATLKAEILSYSRSRGLFAGVALDGSVLRVDQRATALFYAPRPGQPPGAYPASALKLLEEVAAHATPPNRVGAVPPVAVPVPAEPPLAEPVPPLDTATLAAPLGEAERRLQAILDPQWKRYLALPPEVMKRDQLVVALERYNGVARDPRYRELAGRREFQEVHGLLGRLDRLMQAPPQEVLKLPPPPQ